MDGVNIKISIATISELQAIPSKENGEQLINLGNFDSNIRSEYRRTDAGLKIVNGQSFIINLKPFIRQFSTEIRSLLFTPEPEDQIQKSLHKIMMCSRFKIDI